MSVGLTVEYTLSDPMRTEDIETHLRHCFDSVGCTRTAPDDAPDSLAYMPDGDAPERVTGASIEEAITAVAASEGGTLWCWYEHQYVGLTFNAESTSGGIVPFSLLLDGIYAKSRTNEHPHELRTLVREMYDALSPWYLRGDTYLREQTVDLDAVDRGDVQEVRWVTGYGPDVVQKVGRSLLLDAPAWRIDECDDGGIILWAAELPLAPESPATAEAMRDYFEV